VQRLDLDRHRESCEVVERQPATVFGHIPRDLAGQGPAIELVGAVRRQAAQRAGEDRLPPNGSGHRCTAVAVEKQASRGRMRTELIHIALPHAGSERSDDEPVLCVAHGRLE
jgi:hypothetical protein